MTDSFARTFDRLLDGLAILSGGLLAAIPMMIIYDAGLRILKIGASVWVNDVSAIFIVYSTFLAAPWLLRENGHIYVNVVANLLSKSNQKYLARVVNLCCAAVCVYLTYKATLVVIANYGYYDVSAIETPRWLRFLPVPFGFFFLSLQFLRDTVSHVGEAPEAVDSDQKGTI